MKVLIVDDDPNTVQMIEDSIPWEEYGISEIFAAYHGQMAMEIIGKEEPDVVISDIEMPQMDGMELLEAMEETLPTMPEIILLTCPESNAVWRQCLPSEAIPQRGADGSAYHQCGKMPEKNGRAEDEREAAKFKAAVGP